MKNTVNEMNRGPIARTTNLPDLHNPSEVGRLRNKVNFDRETGNITERWASAINIMSRSRDRSAIAVYRGITDTVSLEQRSPSSGDDRIIISIWIRNYDITNQYVANATDYLL